MTKGTASILLSLFTLSFTVGCGNFGSAMFNSSSSTSVPGERTPLEVVLQDEGVDWRELHAEDYGIPLYTLPVKPGWETSPSSKWKDYGEDFSQYAAFVIDHEAPHLLTGLSQITNSLLCPKYTSLSREQKINFWVIFVAEVTRYESGFSPVSRYFESTFNYKDEVTGEGVYSEGLLQLSYQDGQSYKKECGAVFDWEADKKLDRADARKTILNPLRNLYCGIRIMDSIVKNKKQIFFNSGHYWAVLKTGSTYGKVIQIQSSLAKIPFCR